MYLDEATEGVLVLVWGPVKSTITAHLHVMCDVSGCICGTTAANAFRYVMDDATKDSLVLVDELGKGTEVRAGAAIAGAMLEHLDSTGCRGIFAT